MVRIGICLFMIANCCVADQTITAKVAFTPLPGVLDEQESSPYNRLLEVVSQKTNVKFEGNFYPSIRSNHFLETGDVDCIFPISLGGYKRQVKTLFSESFNIVTSHFFTLRPPGINSLEEASAKTVVYQRGYLFANLVLEKKNNISFVPVESTEAALQLLRNGRADAYLEYMPDLKFGLSQERFGELFTDFDEPLQTLQDVIECSDTSKNREVIKGFNSVLTELKATDQLKHILGKYYNMGRSAKLNNE